MEFFVGEMAEEVMRLQDIEKILNPINSSLQQNEFSNLWVILYPVFGFVQKNPTILGVVRITQSSDFFFFFEVKLVHNITFQMIYFLLFFLVLILIIYSFNNHVLKPSMFKALCRASFFKFFFFKAFCPKNRTLNKTSGSEAALVKSRLESCLYPYLQDLYPLPRRWFLSLKIASVDQMSVLFKTKNWRTWEK